MIRYDSSWLKFEPIDPDTPEGAAEIQEFLARAIEFRMHPPKKRGRMAIPCDINGIFGKPIFLENVIVVCEHRDEHLRDFCKKFCELYLRTDEGSNSMRFIRLADFPNTQNYRAAIWIRDGGEMPFKVDNQFFGKTNDDKPVFIFGRPMIESCRGKDLDSPYVRARMEKVYKASLEEVIFF